MPAMSQKLFKPICDDYAFFQQHSTKAAADIWAYMLHLHPSSRGDTPVRMLDLRRVAAGRVTKQCTWKLQCGSAI